MAVKTIALFAAAALVAIGLVWFLAPRGTPPIATSGGIATLETVRLGGMEQWILIRGENRANPVLLWLHGGPGSAQMPVAHATTRALEAHYTVVHWDQRGAGKSNPLDFDESSLTLERFMADVNELTRHLKQRVGDPPIVLLGHSWGTMLGARAVSRWPDDYAAYVSVGQVVSTARANALILEWLKPQVMARGEPGQIAVVGDATPDSLNDHARFVAVMRMLDSYGGGMNVPTRDLLMMVLGAPEYSGYDLWRWVDGANRGSGPMWDDYRTRDLFADVPVLPVPAFFLSGRRDMNTPHALTVEYVDRVEAPLGIELVTFESSGHAPFLTEPQRFIDELIRIRQTLPAAQVNR